MPDFTLKAESSLGSLARSNRPDGIAPGVIITERTNVSLCSILARKSGGAHLTQRVRGALGTELPCVPKHTGPGTMAFAWAGEHQWLAIAENQESWALERQLQAMLENTGSVVDQSDGRTMLQVGGPSARDALVKGVHIDLHPSVFRPGDAAITMIAHISAHFWQIDMAPTFEFVIPRSFAVAFTEWLIESAAEYGVAMA